MKLLILTSSEARHAHFAYTLIQSFSGNCEVKVVVEPKGRRPQIKRQLKMTKAIAVKSQKLIKQYWDKRYREHFCKLMGEKREVECKLFNDIHRTYAEICKQYQMAVIQPGESLNDAKYVDMINLYRPDIIAVMGTGMVGAQLIAAPRIAALNLHTGLSPYYRGGFTNLFPFINNELQYCGVTVHYLSVGIDSGDIIYNGLPVWCAADTFATINAKSIVLGTHLMVRAIADIAGSRAAAKKQWVKGRLYNDRDFHGRTAYLYYNAMKSGIVSRFVKDVASNKVAYPNGLLHCIDRSFDQVITSTGKC